MNSRIILNTMYGATGSPHFRFFDSDIASAITLTGQAGINVTEKTINDYLTKLVGIDKPYVLAMDTDSCYTDMSDLVKKLNIPKDKVVQFLDTFGATKFKDAISTGVSQFNKDVNSFEDRLYFKRESIANAIIVQKKRYAFMVYDNEGIRYVTPELKITGLESQRSSTPKWCRTNLETTFEEMFFGTEQSFQKMVADMKKQYMELPLSTLTAASSANNLNQFIGHDGMPIKGTPAHIKGAIAFNSLLDKMGLDNTYQKINNGDKVKLLALKMPNPARNDTIAFSDKIPPEFQIDKYVDKNAMFNKFFLNPLSKVADVRGWNCVKTTTLF